MKIKNICASFDYLKLFDKVIVTGPPRAGTTITSKIIADSIGYKFIDELWYDGSDAKKFWFLLNLPRKLVIQMTAFIKQLDYIVKDRDDIAVVLVKRDVDDINVSLEHTTTFGHSDIVGVLPHPEYKEWFLNHYGLTEGCIPTVIYDYFRKHTRDKIKNYFEVEYESFKNHSSWIDKPKRREHFVHIKQINLDPEYITKKTGIMVTECENYFGGSQLK